MRWLTKYDYSNSWTTKDRESDKMYIDANALNWRNNTTHEINIFIPVPHSIVCTIMKKRVNSLQTSNWWNVGFCVFISNKNYWYYMSTKSWISYTSINNIVITCIQSAPCKFSVFRASLNPFGSSHSYF